MCWLANSSRAACFSSTRRTITAYKMFKRKLRALGAPESFSLNMQDDTSFRQLVTWILEEKLPHLRNNSEAKGDEASTPYQWSDDAWDALLDEYLVSVACPFPSADRTAVVDWLLRRCVARDHADIDCTFRLSNDFNRLMVLRGESAKGTVIERGQAPAQIFAGVDDTSDAFREGVAVLAGMIAVPVHLDPKITLQAVAIVLQKLSDETVISAAPSTPFAPSASVADGGAAEQMEDRNILLNSVPLGISVSEPELEPALRIIRLLHIAKLRDLQTRFDEALVALQQITANPQTDTALGKTGRG